MIWVVDTPKGLERLNPMHELYKFIMGSVAKKRTQIIVDVACKKGVLATSLPFNGKCYEFGAFDLPMAEAMMSFAIQACKVRDDEHTHAVLNDIAGLGAADRKAPDDHPHYKYIAFNRKVQLCGCGPILRDLALRGDAGRLEWVLSEYHPPMTYHVCGLLGQSPLMIAASAGHVNVVKMLLVARADPNADDQFGDTPLHYAAFGGKVETARVLVHAGAREDRVNTRVETPLTIARNNPAGFLGVDTQATLDLLLAVRWVMRGDEELI